MHTIYSTLTYSTATFCPDSQRTLALGQIENIGCSNSANVSLLNTAKSQKAKVALGYAL